MQYFDKSTVICVAITSIVLFFYSYLFFGACLLGLILFLSLRYEWVVSHNKKINNVIKNITVSVVTIFSLTVLGEIWLQVYPHRFTGIDGLDIVGDFSDYTSRGYLTEDIFRKRPGVIRILGLGDSFSVNLKDAGKNYHNFVQQKLNGSGKGEVEIINAGMEAIGPGYYYHILNKFGDSFKPDLVIVGFFVGNDIEQYEFSILIGNFIYEPKDYFRRYLRYYQFSHLRLYKLLKNKYTLYLEEQRKKQEAKRYPPQHLGYFSEETFLEVERMRSWIFDKNNWELLQKEWRKCSNVILKMKDWCDQRKIKLVIAILPDQFQVDQATREAVLTRYKNIEEKNMDLSQPNNLIVNFCRAHNINCLDMLRNFQEKGKNERLYILRDTHWNEAGNRLAADLIFEYLEENQLVPHRPLQ
jgi:hypothetical protein